MDTSAEAGTVGEMGASNGRPTRPHRKSGTIWAATAAALALVVSGCGQDNADSDGGKQEASSSSSSAASDQGSPKSEANGAQQKPKAGKAETQWIGDFCGGMAKVTGATADVSQPDGDKPEDITNTMSEMLGSIMKGDKAFLSDLDDMDSSPVKGGGDLVDTTKDSYQDLYDTADDAKSDLDDTSVSGKKEAKKEVQSVQQDIEKVDLEAPLKKLQSNKKLVGAFQEAPKCQKLVQSAQKQQQQQQQQQPGGGNGGAPQPGN